MPKHRSSFNAASHLDPNFAGGYWGLAWAQLHAATGLQNCDLLETQSSAEKLTRRAVGLNEADAEARSSLAFALLMRGDHYGALAEAERALALSQTRSARSAAEGPFATQDNGALFLFRLRGRG